MHFEAWCSRHALDALPASPETVALYMGVLEQWNEKSG
jgi:hypothetical protein